MATTAEELRDRTAHRALEKRLTLAVVIRSYNAPRARPASWEVIVRNVILDLEVALCHSTRLARVKERAAYYAAFFGTFSVFEVLD